MTKKKHKMPIIIPNQKSFERSTWFPHHERQKEEEQKEYRYQRELAKRRRK